MVFSDSNKLLAKTALIVAGMLLLALILRPAIIGYMAYQKAGSINASIEEYRKNAAALEIELAKSKTNLSVCTDFSQKVFEELDSQMVKYADCASSFNALALNHSIAVSNFERELSDLRAKLEAREKEAQKADETKEEELKNLRNEYDTLAKNAANNICCKEKVDNANIKYYSVEGNRIICLETGEKALAC